MNGYKLKFEIKKKNNIIKMPSEHKKVTTKFMQKYIEKHSFFPDGGSDGIKSSELILSKMSLRKSKVQMDKLKEAKNYFESIFYDAPAGVAIIKPYFMDKIKNYIQSIKVDKEDLQDVILIYLYEIHKQETQEAYKKAKEYFKTIDEKKFKELYNEFKDSKMIVYLDHNMNLQRQYKFETKTIELYKLVLEEQLKNPEFKAKLDYFAEDFSKKYLDVMEYFEKRYRFTVFTDAQSYIDELKIIYKNDSKIVSIQKNKKLDNVTKDILILLQIQYLDKSSSETYDLAFNQKIAKKVGYTMTIPYLDSEYSKQLLNKTYNDALVYFSQKFKNKPFLEEILSLQKKYNLTNIKDRKIMLSKLHEIDNKETKKKELKDAQEKLDKEKKDTREKLDKEEKLKQEKNFKKVQEQIDEANIKLEILEKSKKDFLEVCFKSANENIMRQYTRDRVVAEMGALYEENSEILKILYKHGLTVGNYKYYNLLNDSESETRYKATVCFLNLKINMNKELEKKYVISKSFFTNLFSIREGLNDVQFQLQLNKYIKILDTTNYDIELYNEGEIRKKRINIAYKYYKNDGILDRIYGWAVYLKDYSFYLIKFIRDNIQKILFGVLYTNWLYLSRFNFLTSALRYIPGTFTSMPSSIANEFLSYLYSLLPNISGVFPAEYTILASAVTDHYPEFIISQIFPSTLMNSISTYSSILILLSPILIYYGYKLFNHIYTWYTKNSEVTKDFAYRIPAPTVVDALLSVGSTIRTGMTGTNTALTGVNTTLTGTRDDTTKIANRNRIMMKDFNNRTITIMRNTQLALEGIRTDNQTIANIQQGFIENFAKDSLQILDKMQNHLIKMQENNDENLGSLTDIATKFSQIALSSYIPESTDALKNINTILGNMETNLTDRIPEKADILKLKSSVELLNTTISRQNTPLDIPTGSPYNDSFNDSSNPYTEEIDTTETGGVGGLYS